MPMFRVTAERPCGPPPGHHSRNPFLIGDIFNLPPMRVVCRTWEFQARSEKQVRELFEEAKRLDIDNVRGFHLTTIERIDIRIEEQVA